MKPKQCISIISGKSLPSSKTGKSTLFNKIAGGKIAIIEDIAGVTRDRLYQDVSWNNKNFTIIDTGGIEDEKENFQKEIRIQAEFAISEASIILFVVDGKLGLTKDDLIIRDILRRSRICYHYYLLYA